MGLTMIRSIGAPCTVPARRNQRYAGKLQPMVLKMMTNIGVSFPSPTPPVPKGVVLGNTTNICTAEGNSPAERGRFTADNPAIPVMLCKLSALLVKLASWAC